MAKQDPNLRIGLVGIVIGLVGITISVILPGIELNLKWIAKQASGWEIFFMFFYYALSVFLLWLSWIVGRNTFTVKPKKKKKTNKLWERASIETFFDAIKWLIFLYLAIIWLGETPQALMSRWPWLILFVVALFIINVIRENKLEKYK